MVKDVGKRCETRKEIGDEGRQKEGIRVDYG
jgi:hypothetical protein